jgi:hypothetical protein
MTVIHEAAIRYHGICYRGRTHAECFGQIAEAIGYEPEPGDDPWISGFLTIEGHFLTHTEAETLTGCPTLTAEDCTMTAEQQQVEKVSNALVVQLGELTNIRKRVKSRALRNEIIRAMASLDLLICALDDAVTTEED